MVAVSAAPSRSACVHRNCLKPCTQNNGKQINIIIHAEGGGDYVFKLLMTVHRVCVHTQLPAHASLEQAPEVCLRAKLVSGIQTHMHSHQLQAIPARIPSI